MNARPIELFHFHNLVLTVVEAEQIRYVRLRPITDLLGLTWKHARSTVLNGDNQALYDARELSPLPTDTLPPGIEPIFIPEKAAVNTKATPCEQEAFSAPNGAENDACPTEEDELLTPYGGEKSALTKHLFIRLDRVHLYLARVNTSRLRANGKEDAADYLLALQQEWGEALYHYETHGIAIKSGQHKSLKELFAMRKHASAEEKARLTYLITLALDAMGCPQASEESSPQIDMFGGEV